MLADLIFILFAFGLMLGAGTVVAAKNPMYCVLGMITAFTNAAGLFILMQAEFLGLLLVMVYVGAIAVMFLFVLMTIDIDFATMRARFSAQLPIGLLVAGALLAEFIFAAKLGLFSSVNMAQPLAVTVSHATADTAATLQANPLRHIGLVLFTDYVVPFQVAGMVLLTAMVGAIVLTHRRRPFSKQQHIGQQIHRQRQDSLVITQPKVGQGASAKHWQPKTVSITRTQQEDD